MTVDVCRVLWVSHHKLAGLTSRRRQPSLLKQLLVTNLILKAQNVEEPESPESSVPAPPNGTTNDILPEDDADLWAFAAELEGRLSVLEYAFHHTSIMPRN